MWSVQKRQNLWFENCIFKSHFCHRFVFFAHDTKSVLFGQNFTRVLNTCICLCPIFVRFFRHVFVFYKFRKTNRVHMHLGAKVDFPLWSSGNTSPSYNHTKFTSGFFFGRILVGYIGVIYDYLKLLFLFKFIIFHKHFK